MSERGRGGRVRRGLVGLSAVRVLWLPLSLCGWAAGATEPAQQPLITRVGEVPKPNVMVTLDDSGSMLADYMPEGSFKVNNKSVAVAGGWVAGFPGDPRKGGSGSYQVSTALAEKLAASTSDNLQQIQYRSPDINSIWYNPDIRYLPWIKPDGGRMDNSTPTAARWDPIFNPTATFDLVTKRSFNITWSTNASGSTTTTSKSFSPGLYYRLKAGADPTAKGSYVRYDVNVENEQGPTTKAAARTDCAGTRCTVTEERQNFANWFTYYRMRESLSKAALSEALSNYVGKMRVGWGQINKTSSSSIDGKNFTVIQKGIRPLDTAHLSTVLTGIQGVESWPGTPLRTALKVVGSYFEERNSGSAAQAGNPWLTTIGDAGSGRLACRRSVNLLTTDGYYNDGSPGVGDWDSNSSLNYDYSGSVNNPDGHSPTKYSPQRPYKDGATTYSDTLADVAMKYFIRDLDSQVPNRVAPVDGDIAFWQHLTQFTVGIGVKGTLDSSSPAAKKSTLAALKAGTLDWTNPSSNAGKIDDLWHAAVNTGGDFYSVTNVTELTKSLYDAFGKAVGNIAREAGVATVATTLSASNIKFVPEYKSVAWYGDVKAYALDEYGSVPNGSAALWSASAVLPVAANRSLYTFNGSTPVEFKWATIGATNQAALTEDLLNYVRGDQSREGTDSSDYRARYGKLLGDFVNSPPVLVKDLVDLSYELLSDTTQAASYRAYVAAKALRSNATLFVGGNAGILHGFRVSDGVEVFGFLPRTGLANLPQIADQAYGGAGVFHRFFVDGPLLETDAYIVPRGESAARWTNVLLGSMGAGGKSVFALTVPVADPTAMSANSLQWELTGDSDLGYVMSSMRVGKIQGSGGGWYAFVPNGAHSDSGNAVLLVVNLQTGAIAGRITLPSSGANGLMGVRLLRNSRQEVYAAYAGDLQGNLWRIDFEGASSSTWKVGLKGQPLFRARNDDGTVQPIMAPPTVILHPSGGTLVLFGTGRLVDLTDAGNTALQSFYGVWDKTPVEASSVLLDSHFAEHEGGGGNAYRSKLVEQTISTDAVQSSQGSQYYVVSSNTVNWSAKKGWFMDLTIAPGQRVTFGAQTLLGWVFFTSIVPAGQAAECEVTSSGAYSFMLDALTGGAATTTQFDINGDGVIDATDNTSSTDDGGIAGYQTSADGADKLLGERAGLVDDEDSPLTGNAAAQAASKQCQGSSKCAAGYCLVVVVNTSNAAEEMCVKASCQVGTAEYQCCMEPHSEGCCDPHTDPLCEGGNTKPIKDRIWKRLITIPSAG